MRVKIKDVTSSSEYGALRVGDVVDVDDASAERWCNSGIAEAAKGAEPHRTVPAPPRFASEGPHYGQVIDRRSLGDYPTNVVPEVQERLKAQDDEIARLRAQLAAKEGGDAHPLARYGLDDKHRDALFDAGYDHPDKVAAASDDDLLKAGLPKAGLAKVRG
jgi:uncharacterized small protein (DUF1192 family)